MKDSIKLLRLLLSIPFALLRKIIGVKEVIVYQDREVVKDKIIYQEKTVYVDKIIKQDIRAENYLAIIEGICNMGNVESIEVPPNIMSEIIECRGTDRRLTQILGGRRGYSGIGGIGYTIENKTVEIKCTNGPFKINKEKI